MNDFFRIVVTCVYNYHCTSLCSYVSMSYCTDSKILKFGENDIGAPKMQIYFGAIKLFVFSNIVIAICDFSIAPLKVIALSLLCFIFGISVGLCFFSWMLFVKFNLIFKFSRFSLLKAKSFSLLFAIKSDYWCYTKRYFGFLAYK